LVEPTTSFLTLVARLCLFFASGFVTFPSEQLAVRNSPRAALKVLPLSFGTTHAGAEIFTKEALTGVWPLNPHSSSI
jgi:hypothetical protein